MKRSFVMGGVGDTIGRGSGEYPTPLSYNSEGTSKSPEGASIKGKGELFPSCNEETPQQTQGLQANKVDAVFTNVVGKTGFKHLSLDNPSFAKNIIDILTDYAIESKFNESGTVLEFLLGTKVLVFISDNSEAKYWEEFERLSPEEKEKRDVHVIPEEQFSQFCKLYNSAIIEKQTKEKKEKEQPLGGGYLPANNPQSSSLLPSGQPTVSAKNAQEGEQKGTETLIRSNSLRTNYFQSERDKKEKDKKKEVEAKEEAYRILKEEIQKYERKREGVTVEIQTTSIRKGESPPFLPKA